MSDKNNLLDLEAEFQALRDSAKTLQLATTDSNGLPLASYAPYVWFDQKYYLFLSELAKHTLNLIDNHKLSLLIIESEEGCRNLFARRRIVLQGEVVIIERKSSCYLKVISEFKQRFGEIIDVIEPLQDFHLFQVQPASGRFIRGFAQAFELSGPELNEIRHIDSSNS